MEEYDEKTYGEKIAQVYDDLYSESDPDSIKLLAELARGGPALELGIGSGRIALPLFDSGIAVQGIDASERMIGLLKSKPHGGEIEVINSSFASFKIEKRFRLIYVVFNTFFALLTQEEQLSCFQCAHEHLSPGGSFLLEVFVPDMNRFEKQSDSPSRRSSSMFQSTTRSASK
jgi:SAM-dependent methyltransferase